MANHRGYRLLMVAVLVGLPAAAAHSQAAQPTLPINLWVSGGLGPSSYYTTSGTALRGSATLSVGRAVVKVRKSLAFEGLESHKDLEERAVLGGWRLGRDYVYFIPAAGVSSARYDDDICTDHIICTPQEAAQFQEVGAVMAFDFGLHASRSFIGVAVNVSGTAGSPKRNHTALTFSLEFGAFRP